MLSIVSLPGPLHATQFSFSLSNQYFDYEETEESGESLNTEIGWLFGGRTSIKLKLSDRLSLTGFFAYQKGTVDYDGQTQLGFPHQTKTIEKRRHAGGELDFLLFESSLFSETQVFSHAGLSRRQWHRHIQPNNGVLGLDEWYYWNEFVLGFSAKQRIDKDKELHFRGSLLFGLDQYLEVDLRPSGFDLVELELGSIFGQELHFQYDHKLNSSLSFFSKLEVNHWHFERSETVTTRSGSTILGVTEPESNTLTASINLGLRWAF